MMRDYLPAYPPNGAVVRERATGRMGTIIGTRMFGLLVEWDERVEWSEHRFTLCPTYRGWQSWHGYGAVELMES